jgi:hypothetical protein
MKSRKKGLTKMTTVVTWSKRKKYFIGHMKELSNFPNDSTMVKYMEQQGWSGLEDMTMIGLDEVMDSATFKDDGILKPS